MCRAIEFEEPRIMTPALMDLILEQQKTALSESFRLLQGVCNVPRMLRRAGHNRGFTTAHRVVYTEGPMRLLQFHRESPPVWAEPLLICSAPVSRPYILDLGASRSVVRQMLAAGFDTYLIDWGIATAADRGTRLCDLADRMLKNVVQLIRNRSRMPHFHLMGYCLGGTLATIFTALYPSVVKDLVLMSAPIDLDGDNTLLKAWANQDCFDVDLFIDAFGNCPGIFLRSFFALLDPVRNLYGKFGDLAGRMHDEEFVESFVALQQWANAQVSVAGEVFRDVVKLLYQRNLLARGQLVIEGAPVRLDRITCAVLLLTATADQLVTPLSTMGLVPRICSRDVKSMSLEGGHESLAVSSKAHQTFWPEAAQWIADHSTPRTGPWIRPGESASGRPEFVFAEKVDPASKCSQEPTA